MDVSGICGFLKTHNLSAYSWPSLRQTSVSKLTICPWELFGLVALEETLLSFSWRKSHWQNGLLSRILHLLKTFLAWLVGWIPVSAFLYFWNHHLIGETVFYWNLWYQVLPKPGNVHKSLHCVIFPIYKMGHYPLLMNAQRLWAPFNIFRCDPSHDRGLLI